MNKNEIFQDNQNAIRLNKNGKNSCTGNSRHIDIKYVFVKDMVINNEVSISYCPTLNMLADFYTKPLQGALFKKFRSVLMGYESIDILFKPDFLTFEERVGNSQKVTNIQKVSFEENECLENRADDGRRKETRTS